MSWGHHILEGRTTKNKLLARMYHLWNTIHEAERLSTQDDEIADIPQLRTLWAIMYLLWNATHEAEQLPVKAVMLMLPWLIVVVHSTFDEKPPTRIRTLAAMMTVMMMQKLLVLSNVWESLRDNHKSYKNHENTLCFERQWWESLYENHNSAADWQGGTFAENP